MSSILLAATNIFAASGVTSFTHIGASYQRNTTNQSTRTFTPPAGAVAGDLLILTSFTDDDDIITGAPSGWTLIGDNDGLVEYPAGGSYFIIYDGTTSSWTVTWDVADTGAGIVVAFRPDNPITTVTTEQFQSDEGPSSLSNSITTVADDPAVGGRIYMYFLTGRPISTIQNPTPTFTPSTGWTHVDGEPLAAEDYMDYAYKLASAGDAFVSTTISTNDTGRQAQHFFIVNAV
jgi:hypothetical protein